MKQDNQSKLIIVIGFLALSYLFQVEVLKHIALILGLIFVVSNRLSSYVLWLWDKLAHVLGWINTRILLTAIFFVFLLPIALLFKLFNRDPLSMSWKKDGSSFAIRDHLYQKEDLENPW